MGRVLPSTVESVLLVGQMEDGREVVGESNIAHDPPAIKPHYALPRRTDVRFLKSWYAIQSSRYDRDGTGKRVYTSVIPNLLVTEIAEARGGVEGDEGVRLQRDDPEGRDRRLLTPSDHVHAIEEHAGRKVFEYVLVNTARPGADMLDRYTKSGSDFVDPDLDVLTARGYRAVKGSFISESAVVRHDSDKLARKILKLYDERRPWLK